VTSGEFLPTANQWQRMRSSSIDPGLAQAACQTGATGPKHHQHAIVRRIHRHADAMQRLLGAIHRQ
jgi:hypothetical protein